MHFLVAQSLGRLKAALAAGASAFVAVAPHDLETLRRAARRESLDGLRGPADRREVCVPRKAAEELAAAVEAADEPPPPEGEVPGDD